jgi:very-short-patch-repair endonuclease
MAASRAPSRPAELETRLTALAGNQHGVVSRAQLLDGGVPATWVDSRVRSRRLQPVHRGVYLVGPLRTRYTRPMAALLAAGPGAAIGYRSSGALWGFTPAEPEDAPVHVIVINSDRGRTPGLRPHRVPLLPDDEVTMLQGIRLTTPCRTLLDLAGHTTTRQLAQAIARAQRNERLDPNDLSQLLERYPRRRAVGTLRRLLESETAVQLTRSAAEERFLQLVRRAQLPRPETNVTLRGLEVDFFWRGHRLVVEVDGFASHSSRHAFEKDRRRDEKLTASGFQVLRFTCRQLKREPEAVVARLAQALTQRDVSTST